MKKNKMWGILAGCIFCTALFPCTVKANNETQTIMNELVRASPGWDLNRIDSTLTFSQDDAVRLMKIAAAEGGNQGAYGQYLIMRVVLNRLTSNRYPDTIKEVIADKGQFETYEEGIYQKTEPNLDSHLALGMLETTLNSDTEIIGFETKENGRALEKYYDYKFTYKDHDFYVSKQ